MTSMTLSWQSYMHVWVYWPVVIDYSLFEGRFHSLQTNDVYFFEQNIFIQFLISKNSKQLRMMTMMMEASTLQKRRRNII